MPRVNRDLQRRMAARRERERRRPSTGRRYQFGPAETAAEPRVDGAEAEVETEVDEPVGTDVAPTRVRTPRSGATARPAPLPFTAYREEYRYVLGDLKRVGIVVG